jgi:hypothetical protein
VFAKACIKGQQHDKACRKLQWIVDERPGAKEAPEAIELLEKIGPPPELVPPPKALSKQ